MDAKRFGAFISERRKEHHMTQADLAGKVGVTDKAVSRWERGLGFPDINTCLLYTSPSPRDRQKSRMPSSA